MKDGMPAFPLYGRIASNSGMTLRDYFAAKAMQGFLAAREAAHVGEDGDKVLAQDAYICADAMLAEREK